VGAGAAARANPPSIRANPHSERPAAIWTFILPLLFHGTSGGETLARLPGSAKSNPGSHGVAATPALWETLADCSGRSSCNDSRDYSRIAFWPNGCAFAGRPAEIDRERLVLWQDGYAHAMARH